MSIFQRRRRRRSGLVSQQREKARAAARRNPRSRSFDVLEDRRLLALTYVFTPLPDLAGGDTVDIATAINNDGMVVGTGNIAGSNERATQWENVGGTITATDLGTLSGKSQSQATDISENGYVVGRSGASKTGTGSSQVNADRGYIYDPTTTLKTDLGDLPGGDNWSAANAANIAKQAAGSSGAGNASHGFVWGPSNANEVQQITITGAPTSGTYQLKLFNVTSVAIAYNASAATVQSAIRGMSNIGSGNANVTGSAAAGYTVTFVSQRANMNIPLLFVANSTLDNGATVDVTSVTQGTRSGMTDVGDLSGGLDISIVNGMNDGGVAVGAGSTGNIFSPDTHALVWDAIRGLRDLGAPSVSGGAQYSLATDVNNLGIAVGQALSNTAGLSAVLWDSNSATPSTTITALPQLTEGGQTGHNALANAINEFGVVVGTAKLPVSDTSRAFVWIPGRGTFDLNSSDWSGAAPTGWTLTTANDVNDLGQIVGSGTNDLGATQGFVLTPVNTKPVLQPYMHNYVNQGSPLVVNSSASDADGDTLTYSLGAGAPAGMVIDPNTGIITWTPDASAPSEVAVEVTVTDDGWGTKSDTRTLTIGVKRNLFFYDTFEGGLSGTFWSTQVTGQGQASAATGTSVGTGTRSLRLQSTGSDAVKDLAAATLTLNMTGVTQARLAFHQLEGSFGTANDDEPDVLADSFTLGTPGSEGDGLAISVDGTNWYRLLDIQNTDISTRTGDGLWQLMEYDLDANLARINSQFGVNLQFGASTKIRFSQLGLRNYPTDGFFIDEVKVVTNSEFFSNTLPKNVFHVMDTSDPELSYRIGMFGTVTNTTPILVTVHGAGREIAPDTTYWQNYIANPTNGVTGLVVIAPYFAADGRYDDYGRLAWNAQNDAAADLALLNIVKEVTDTGVGSGAQLNLFGFSRGAAFVEGFAWAHPDRVAAIVSASADRHTAPSPGVPYPYGSLITPLFPPPPGVTFNETDFLQTRMMFWVGQNDTVPEDTSDAGNSQGKYRRDRSQNMYAEVTQAAIDAGLANGTYEYQLYVKENQDHIFFNTDIDTYYKFLFKNFNTSEVPANVYAVPVLFPSASQRSASLPTALSTVNKDTDFYLEFYVRAPGATGVSASTVDFAYDTSLLNSSTGDINHGTVFSGSPTGTVDDANGRIRSLGGTTAQASVGVNEYALLGRVKFHALSDLDPQRQIFAALQSGNTPITLVGGAQPRTVLRPVGTVNIDSTNTPPIASAGGPYQVSTGQNLVLSAAGSSDPDLGPNPLTYSWDVNGDGVYGDATGVAPTLTPAQLSSLGIVQGPTYSVTVRVSDGPATVTSAPTTLSLGNAAPIANAGGPYNVNEGQNVTLSAAGSSDPDGGPNPLTYSWDINNDGTFGDATGVSPTITWAQLQGFGMGEGPNAFSIKVRVSDGQATTTSAAATLNVVNVGPSSTASGTGGYRGESRSFTFTASDPSAVDQGFNFTYNIDWDNNGTVDQTTSGPGSGVNVSHSFFASGAATVRVTATDRQGATGAAFLLPVITTDFVLRSNGGGQVDLIWGGTNGLDVVYFYNASGGAINILQTLENSAGVTKLNRVSGVTGKVIAFGYDQIDLMSAEFVTGRAVSLVGGNGDDTLVGGFQGDNLDGGEGNDLLVGGTQGTDGNDTILGGNGKDLLLGHRGLDSLNGGGGEDLIISGIVSFPDLPTAIFAIQSEWLSGRTYAERVANISGTGVGTRNNGSFFLTPGSTVLNDSAVDTIVGGTEMDWFLYTLAQDLYNETNDPSETKTNI